MKEQPPQFPWEARIEGLEYSAESAAPALRAYLDQLRDEACALVTESGWLLAWEHMDLICADPAHDASRALLRLPPRWDDRARFAAHGAVSDSGFAIVLDGWCADSGAMSESVKRVAGLVVGGDRCWLLPMHARRACDLAAQFDGKTTESVNDRWRRYGQWRTEALLANAELDDFLTRTVALAPQKIRLELSSTRAFDTPVVEVRPSFDGAPEGWLNAVDRYDRVQDRYVVTGQDGSVTHVAPSEPVKEVLQTVKTLPGRRVASQRARAFVRNPFAVLGDSARAALDPEQVDEAIAQAAIPEWRAAVRPVRDEAKRIRSAEIVLEDVHGAPDRIVAVESIHALADLAKEARAAQARSAPCFVWRGLDLEAGPALERLTDDLDALIGAWKMQSATVLYADVVDLFGYSDRVVGLEFGEPNVAPYVARVRPDHGWIPENVETGLIVNGGPTQQTQLVPLDGAARSQLRAAVVQARKHGVSHVDVPGVGERVPVAQAERIIDALDSAEVGLGKGRAPGPQKDPDTRGPTPSLRILHNIEGLQYGRAAEAVSTADANREPAIPSTLRSDLLAHQRNGLGRLQGLHRQRSYGVSGCLLADDMGLGKTLQCLAFIASLRDAGETEPALVVAPVSLLQNWRIEIDRFFGDSLGRVLSLYGEDLRAARANRGEVDAGLAELGLTRFLRPGFEQGCSIVLTTYETLRDYEFSLARVQWGVLVCDEAQRIKNPAALVTRAAKAMKARFRIACTGTPVENTLADLWCLFDFVIPGSLDSLNAFTNRFRKPIETRADGFEEHVNVLRKAIDPFVIRRMKTEVARDLPPKYEGPESDPDALRLSMSPLQLEMYANAVARFRRAMESQENEAQDGLDALRMLFVLRDICSNPVGLKTGLSDAAPIEEHIRHSPKLRWLVSCLGRIHARGEKVILFSELREIQRLLQRLVSHTTGLMPSIINGETSVDPAHETSRQRLVDAFNRSSGFNAIVLSPIAAGVGLNIQAANHVVHFTRHWNPAKEDQATDRAYRIGQSRSVYVYTPIVVGNGFESFDERLAALLASKRALSRDMLAPRQDATVSDFRGL